MGSVRVGTSGYGYLEWVGPVYPAGTAREDFIGLYSRRFRTVELNETAYGMPTAAGLAALAESSGPALSFAVKAHESLTHRVDPHGWKATAHAFVEALEPLREAGRLEAVLLQFPPAFGYGVDERRYLDSLISLLGASPHGNSTAGHLQLAVEFGDPAWYNNRVFDALRSRSVAVASVDLPELGGLPPVIDLVTAPLAYIRLHGRNAHAWWGSDSASRYDYLYTEAELRAWVQRVRGIASRAQKVLVYFNNYRSGQAAANAETFAGLLEKAGMLAESGLCEVTPTAGPALATAPAGSLP
jgi:uncharacterized protein YecE (DUF72 family)